MLRLWPILVAFIIACGPAADTDRAPVIPTPWDVARCDGKGTCRAWWMDDDTPVQYLECSAATGCTCVWEQGLKHCPEVETLAEGLRCCS